MRASKLQALFFQVLTAAIGAAAAGTVAVSCGGSVDAPGTTKEKCRAASSADAGPACGTWVVKVEGDLDTCGFGDASTMYGAECKAICGRDNTQCYLQRATSTVECREICTVDGRRPPGLPFVEHARDDLGAHFARMAYHEAAAVIAFEVLARELAFHGAPASLLRSIRRARDDEKRHAKMAAALARRFGAVPKAPVVEVPKVRSLEEIALENAIEGCGRETFGALVGFHQAEHARDRKVRAFYAAIARDETRHAALAFRIQRWLFAKLSSEARARVNAAWTRALQGADHPANAALRDALGVPDRVVLQRLAEGLRDALAA